MVGLAAAVSQVGLAAGLPGGVVKTGQQSTDARGKDLQTRIDAWDDKLAAIQKRYQRQLVASRRVV